MEVIKMNSVQYALKKDVDQIESKFSQFVSKKSFEELKAECALFAKIEDVEEIENKLKSIDEG